MRREPTRSCCYAFTIVVLSSLWLGLDQFNAFARVHEDDAVQEVEQCQLERSVLQLCKVLTRGSQTFVAVDGLTWFDKVLGQKQPKDSSLAPIKRSSGEVCLAVPRDGMRLARLQPRYGGILVPFVVSLQYEEMLVALCESGSEEREGARRALKAWRMQSEDEKTIKAIDRLEQRLREHSDLSLVRAALAHGLQVPTEDANLDDKLWSALLTLYGPATAQDPDSRNRFWQLTVGERTAIVLFRDAPERSSIFWIRVFDEGKEIYSMYVRRCINSRAVISNPPIAPFVNEHPEPIEERDVSIASWPESVQATVASAVRFALPPAVEPLGR